MSLEDDSGTVHYRLVAIVFRIGGQLDGHFYMAAPIGRDRWVVYNSERTSNPLTRQELYHYEHKNAHGMLYQRADFPARDHWGAPSSTGHAPRNTVPVR